MREGWLNLILSITNRIFAKKQALLEKNGLAVILSVFNLFFYEIFLAFISLPLYIGVKTATAKAYFEEKGGYEKIIFDYNLRRVLTLSVTTFLFFIWFVKLSILVSVPNFYGPLNLYNVSNVEKAGLLDNAIIQADTQIQTAKVVDAMTIPKIISADKDGNGDYIFYGTGDSGNEVVLFLSDYQTEILTTVIDENRNWELKHIQDDFKLKEGNHSASVFSYNKNLQSRSKISETKYFKVTVSLADKIVQNIDILLNFSIILIILLGVLLTVLTL